MFWPTEVLYIRIEIQIKMNSAEHIIERIYMVHIRWSFFKGNPVFPHIMIMFSILVKKRGYKFKPN